MSSRTRISSSPTIISLLALAGLAVAAQMYVSIPLFPTIREVFGVSQTQTALLGTAFGLAYAVGFLVFGPLSDRYGRKRIIVPGLLAHALATLAVGMSFSFAVLIGLRVVQGFAAATFGAVALAYIGEVLPEKLRAVGIAFITTGFLLAAIVGQMYANIVNIAVGWQWVFWGLAGVYGVLSLLTWRLPRSPSFSPSSSSVIEAYADMVRLLRNRTLVVVYLVTVVPLLVLVAMYTDLGSYLQATYGLSQQQLLFVRIAGIPGILLSPLAGRFVARWGSTRVVAGGLVLAALGLVVEGLAGSLVVLVAASAVFVTGVAAAVPALVSLVGETAGSAQGAAMAIYGCVLFVGASLGPLVPTVLPSIGFAGLCGVLAVVSVAAAGVLTLVTTVTASEPSTDAVPTDD